MHLFGFIIKMHHDAPSSECEIFHNNIDMQHLIFLYCWQYHLVQNTHTMHCLIYTGAMVTIRCHNVTL